MNQATKRATATCPRCRGTGEVVARSHRVGGGAVNDDWDTCPTCDGTGTIKGPPAALAELLARWHAIEPNRRRAAGDGTRASLVLAATVDAIEARKLTFSLDVASRTTQLATGHVTTTYGHAASIFTTARGLEGLAAVGFGWDSPPRPAAEALLAAYLSAIEPEAAPAERHAKEDPA